MLEPKPFRSLNPDQKIALLSNVPEVMKQVPQWAVTWLSGPNTKAPIHPHTGKMISVTEPETWSEYSHAWSSVVDEFYHALGFLLTSACRIILIDLDNKYNDPAIKERIDTIAAAYSAAGHYVERSSSGTGYHILLAGNLPGRGRRKEFIEISDNNRFFVLTGDGGGVIKPDEVGTLTELLAQMEEDDTDDIEIDHTIRDIRTPEQIKQAVLAQANTREDVRLALTKGYPVGADKSEVDAQVAEALFFVTQDYALVERIFLSAPMWDADRLAEKNRKRSGKAAEYVTMTLRFAYAKVVARKQQKQQMAQELVRQNVAKVVALPASPADSPSPVLDHPPGVVGQISADFEAMAYKPHRGSAISGAITLCTSLFGRHMNTFTGDGINQMMVNVAHTAVGKETAKRGFNAYQTALEFELGQTLFSVVGRFASGPAALKKMASAVNSSLTLQQDEVAIVLNSVLGGDNEHFTLAFLLQAYSEGGYGGILRSSVYADNDKDTKDVERPNFNMIGSTTPDVYQSYTERSIRSGLIPRIIHILDLNENEASENLTGGPRPDLIAHLRDLYLSCLGRPEVPRVQLSKAAYDLWQDYQHQCTLNRRTAQAAGNETVGDMYSRLAQKALRLGTLLSAVDHDRLGNDAYMRWAIGLVQRDADDIIGRLHSGELLSSDQRGIVQMRKFIVRWTQMTPDERRKKRASEIGANCPTVIPYSYFAQQCRGHGPFKPEGNRTEADKVKAVLDEMVRIGDLVRLDATKAQAHGYNSALVFEMPTKL